MSGGPGWTIREAHAGDADRVALIAGAAFLDTFAGVLDGEAILRHCRTVLSAATFDSYRQDGGTAWLAEADVGSAPLGYALATRPDLPGSRDGDLELKRIYLLSRMRGTGLGKALLDEVVAHARACQFQRLTLGVFHANPRAIAFYERAGFSTVGTRTFRVGTVDYDDVVMALPLA